METVYAFLKCYEPIKEGDGSSIILVWFQNPDQDPFAAVCEKLKTIDWGKEAKDYWL